VSKEKGPKNKSLSTENDGGTRIDLGDDLIEKTAMLQFPHADRPTSPGHDAAPVQVEPPLTADQVPDQIESARILIGEGILEEAKRILRRILLFSASNSEARKLLDEIHESELKQIFGETENPRRRISRRALENQPQIRAEDVMRELDRDLRLGLFAEDGSESSAIELSLFNDREALEVFGDQMDRDFSSSPSTERMDLGIAFLEMGLYTLAVRHFRAAASRLKFEDIEASQDLLLSATGLLAYALILGGRAFDATIALQPLLSDSELKAERKLDLIYLMGRAQECLDKRELAAQWYGQAAEIEPHYRDVHERLRALWAGRS
jgi:tetratricopeptide (TPR) repeat protein